MIKFDGSKFKNSMDEGGISVFQVAVESGLHPNTVYKAINGLSPKPTTVAKLKNAVRRILEKDSSKAAG